MVLQAVAEDMQPLLSLPFTPSTYHVLLADAAGARARNNAKSTKLMNAILVFICVFFMLPSLPRFPWRLRNLSGLGYSPATLGRNILTAGAENSIGKGVKLFPTFWNGLSFVICDGGVSAARSVVTIRCGPNHTWLGQVTLPDVSTVRCDPSLRRGVFERLEPNRQLFRCLDQFPSLGDQKDSILVQFLDLALQQR